ncbi:MAG: hypothetical protein HY329_23610 [Chloroflexi bacterium]|nr:hypothetical protein [Chloroflexota bacterium]
MSQTEISTLELPLTPAMRALLDEICPKRRRRIYATARLTIVLALVFAVATAVTDRQLFAFLAALSLVIIVGLAIVAGRPTPLETSIDRDVKKGVYFRTTGPIHVASLADGDELEAGCALTVGDRTFKIDSQIASKVELVPRGTVEYTAHARRILEIRDSYGRSIYCHPDYIPMGHALE